METKYLIIIFGIIAGVYTWLLRHVIKHPSKDEIDRMKSNVVFKDVCKAQHACVEVEIKNLNKNLSEFKEDTKNDLQEIKNLIRNGGG